MASFNLKTWNVYRSYVTILGDSKAKDETKLKAAQELSENLEVILSSSQYPQFLAHLIKNFLQVLQHGEPKFLAENCAQQVRKLILEMIYRLPTNDYLKLYYMDVLKIALNLLKTDNEENALICLKIILELRRQFRPPFNQEVPEFLQFVKSIFIELPKNLPKIFTPKLPLEESVLSKQIIENLLKETFTTTIIYNPKKDVRATTYNLIPKAVLSLRVLHELPTIVVLLYQIYKQHIHQDLLEIIPLIIQATILEPSLQHRTSPGFNKELLYDFMVVKVKCVSFQAYMMKIYPDLVLQNSDMLVQGIFGTLNLCPAEAANLRKDLFMAMKHFMTSDLKVIFIPFMGILLDEKSLLGTGLTSHEALRPLAYSIVGDFVHHVRKQLPLNELARAVHLYSKHLQDHSLPVAIQTISCRLLLNLVECIKLRSNVENSTQGREILLKILEAFVFKFEIIAKRVLPIFLNKVKQSPLSSIVKSEDAQEIRESSKTNFGFPASQVATYNIAEYRNLVKFLILGVKSVSVNLYESPPKQIPSKESLIFLRLLKWALQALDIYTINPLELNVIPPSSRLEKFQQLRGKEEKELLEHFSGVFTAMHSQTFQEVFLVMIDYMVERILNNNALYSVSTVFLSNQTMSPIFGTILLEFLLEKLDVMGSNVEKSEVYLKLFKCVFGSVSLYPRINETMLRPYLHKIVLRSLELATSTKEPYNYFILLRSLFRSIGGGSHDLLYQEFLPLLPKLLQDLNRFQSGVHQQHMRELLVELCLTVPVRLSSLLPYLSMLMNPLVSALNGSDKLLGQALRTLELCVDNLEPAYINGHIRPVSAELMQALYRTLRDSSDNLAQDAFRILGKLGGENRKVIMESLRLEYNSHATNSPAIITYFQEYSKPVAFSVKKVIETAFTVLNTSTTSPTNSFYQRQAWEVINSYLAATIRLDDHQGTLHKFFNHPSFKAGEISRQQGPFHINDDSVARNVQQTALSGLFIAAVNEELKKSVLGTMISYVRHYTMIAIAQQAGPFPLKNRQQVMSGQDPFVLIDALKVIMGHEKKELCKFGHLALFLILQTATTILGSKERACQLPLMEYLAKKMSSLCYERAWFAKLGGCVAINFFFEKMEIKWILKHLFPFVKALLFVMMDLTGEISNGATDVAKTNLEKLLQVCADPAIQARNPELQEIQRKSLCEATRELITQITSPHRMVREVAISSLRLLAEIRQITLMELIEPHKDILADVIPPMKHRLTHQPVNAQIGIIDGNTFCMSFNPRLFSVDFNVKEHKVFYQDLLFIIEAAEDRLVREPCYKSVINFVPLKKSALQAFSSYHYLDDYRENIFQTLYNALEKTNAEIQKTAFECLKILVSNFQISLELLHATMRPMLQTLGDYRNLSISSLKRLSYLTELFPAIFNETLCNQLLQHLRHLLQSLIQAKNGVSRTGETEQKIILIMETLFKTPAASSRLVETLSKIILQTEKILMVEASSPFRVPLMRFLLRYPFETLNTFLFPSNVNIQQCARLLQFLLGHEEGKPFRDMIQSNPTPLMTLIGDYQVDSTFGPSEKNELRYRAIVIVSILIKFDEEWLPMQIQLVDMIKQIWCNDEYQALHRKVETIDSSHWKEPKLIVKILLHFFRSNPNDIELLFQLLRAFCGKFIPDFQFLKDFLENTVAQDYTVEWKRNAFFKFVEHFPVNLISQELKACVLQHIIIPCFAASFEKGEDKLLVEGSNSENSNNVVSIFISRIIEHKNSCTLEDSLRIYLLQFSCLLVEKASQHIHDVTNKTQNIKLRPLMSFAWPCLINKNCVDPVSRYHGHLLLCHIIDKFSINKSIVLQVVPSLLKAHAAEAKHVVRQALDILIPRIPNVVEEGNTVLTYLTKKIIVEEGHSMAQLSHILQVIVRNPKVYYSGRYHLIPNLVKAIHRLGFNLAMALEYKKLAVEIAEVIIKWELQRIKDESEDSEENGTKRVSNDVALATKKLATQGGMSSPLPVTILKMDPNLTKPIDNAHANSILNFLLRLACEINDTPIVHGNTGEIIAKRCVCLLKMALNPEMWYLSSNFDVSWLEKVFFSVQSPQMNFGSVSKAYELLITLLTLIKKEQVLTIISSVEKGISACLASTDPRIIRLVHGLFSRLMTIFSTEPSSSTVASRYTELDKLYGLVGKYVLDGLNNYESSDATLGTIFGPLWMLKAACTNNESYIDRLMMPFMKVLYKMVNIHLNGKQTQMDHFNDLLIVNLNLVRNRVGVMDLETRKLFVGTILVGLIEKTQEVKIIKAILTILEEWVKNKDPSLVNQQPNLREKSILLVRLMQNVEKRFHCEIDVNAQFLELICFVYQDEVLKLTELTSKLEPAFLSGLRFIQPQIRIKFFEVFDESMNRRLLDRFLYIVCSQGWNMIGPHYWIKQCIQLLIVTVNPVMPIQIINEEIRLPSITFLINLLDNEDQRKFFNDTAIKEESQDLWEDTKEDLMDVDMPNIDSPGDDITARSSTLTEFIIKHAHFLESTKKIQTKQFLTSAVHLCHVDSKLAEQVWIDTFPKFWNILDEQQQSILSSEMIPFICSGAHVIQKDCHPSAIATIVEASSHCYPPILMRPAIMKYLGKTHNIWHRMTLSLEQMILQGGNNQKKIKQEFDCYDFEPEISFNNEYIDSLSDMYSLLCEEDMWSGLWQKHAYYKETLQANSLEQLGFFEQAQGAYDLAMTKFKQDFIVNPAPVRIQKEVMLWEHRWIRCAKELNQWDLLLEYGKNATSKNPLLILESSWREWDWTSMQEALEYLEQNNPKEIEWKIYLHRGFLSISRIGNQNLKEVSGCAELASNSCIREWRRMPHVVSHTHIPLLQAAQKIIDLQETMQIYQNLILTTEASLYPVKAVIKTWKNRMPFIADDLSYWSDIFSWRQLHYKSIMNYLESQPNESKDLAKQFLHAWAQSTNIFGKVARKHNLTSVCLDSLAKIHGVESVSIGDCYQKIKQQVKCYLQMASIKGVTDLQTGLDCIESTDVSYFRKEMISDFYSLKGKILTLLGDSDEANKAFSASVQLNENSAKAWALWGDYLEQVFTGDPKQTRIGVSAITCFLNASRHHNEMKSRKYMAKVLWLLNYDDDKKSLLTVVKNYILEVPPIHWLPWVPQLLMWLVRHEGDEIVDLLNVVGRMFPQAVYFPIRTLYMTLKVQWQVELSMKKVHGGVEGQTGNIQQQGLSEATPIKASEPMMRCSMIMKKLREIHPTILSALEGIVDQMARLRETWYGEVLRHLRQVLVKCYSIAFENRETVSQATITLHVLNFIKKLVSTFGHGMENISSQNENNSNRSAASVALARRIQNTVQDPVFKKMKKEFAQDFDFSNEKAKLLHNLIKKLKKWIKILEEKAKHSPR